MVDLSFIWAGLIAFAVLAYVVLDGFDLGVGVLFLFFEDQHERNLMTNSVAPVWDGNETWLVLGGGGLMAVFPLAYATVLPALYAPIILMLLALIFRGVAFEFRFRTRRWRPVWDWGFALGSIVAAFTQGIALGALVQGIKVADRHYAGGTLVLIGAVSLWTPFLDPIYFTRWFQWPTAYFSAIVPLLLAVCAFGLWQGLTADKHLQPFLSALGLFVISFIGIGISFYPYIVPGALTIKEAAAPDASLGFLLVGAAVLVPIILIYTGYAYWVFRGKVDPNEGYH